MAFERGSHPETQLPCYSIHISGWFRSHGNPPEFWGSRHAPQTTALYSSFLKGGTHGWPALHCCFLCLSIYPERQQHPFCFFCWVVFEPTNAPQFLALHTWTLSSSLILSYTNTHAYVLPVVHACKDAGGLNS